MALEAATSLQASRVTRVLDRVAAEWPSVMTFESGSEIAGRQSDAWVYQAGIGLDFMVSPLTDEAVKRAGRRAEGQSPRAAPRTRTEPPLP